MVLLQSLLAELNPLVKIDGVLGTATVSAVETFQKNNGLIVDGVEARRLGTLHLPNIDAESKCNVGQVELAQP